MKDDNGKLDGKPVFSFLCTELKCAQEKKRAGSNLSAC